MIHSTTRSAVLIAACVLAFAARTVARDPAPGAARLAQQHCPRVAPANGSACPARARHCLWRTHGTDDGHDVTCDCVHDAGDTWKWSCRNGPEIAY